MTIANILSFTRSLGSGVRMYSNALYTIRENAWQALFYGEPK